MRAQRPYFINWEALLTGGAGKFQDGYGLSKLVGERMVETAVERGLSANIVRLGFIGGSSLTGE